MSRNGCTIGSIGPAPVVFVVARFVDKIAGHFFGVVRFKHSCSTRNQTNTETVGKEKAICLLHCCKLVMCGHAQFDAHGGIDVRSEEHTSELQSLMRISYA